MLRAYWTTAYFAQRLRHAVYRCLHPRAPWLTPESIAFLNKWLVPGYCGLEWGAGRSTLWFACRVRQLTSIEHDPQWFERTRASLAKRAVKHVRLVLCDAIAEEYAGAVAGFEDGALDFVLVDGASALRDACAAAAIPKIREGGLLIVDDAQRFLPLDVTVPGAIGTLAEPVTPMWKDVSERLAAWKCQVTCDGLRATVIWRRPVAAASGKSGSLPESMRPERL